MFRPGQPPSKPVSAGRLQKLLRQFTVVMDLNMPGLELLGLEIIGNRFYGCNFSGSVFTDCVIRDCTFELCFFDFSVHRSGTYEQIDARNCVFACSEFREVVMRESEFIQCNFNALTGSSARFEDCDLFHSRFNGCQVESLGISNCNVKEVRFLRTASDRITFTYSNQEDAIFVDEETW